MGVIPALETSYLITTPYLGEQIDKSKVWIVLKGDITKIKELNVARVDIMRDAGSVHIETDYGNFIFPAKQSENKRFAYGGGEVLRIHEYIILN